MSEKPRLRYEKPMSIDLGRVAPILGDTCSFGHGAADCPSGMNNAMVPVCAPSGSGADNNCQVGSSAGTFCYPTGSGAAILCLVGSGTESTSLPGGEPDSGGITTPGAF